MLLLIALTRRRSFFWKSSKVESLAEELIKSGQPIPPMLTLSILFFLSEAQKKVYRQKPQAIEDLVQCAKDYAASYDQETIKRVARNV